MGNPEPRSDKISKYPQDFFHDKPCRLCKSVFSPEAPSHMYCSEACAYHVRFEKRLQRTYGIGVEDYERMREQQSAKCAICGGPGFVLDKNKHKCPLVVDHCHTSGAVRGLLCPNCNRALGLFQDSTESLERAITYLTRCND